MSKPHSHHPHHPHRAGAGRPTPVGLAGIGLVLLAFVAWGLWAWRTRDGNGSRSAPKAGNVIAMGRSEMLKLGDVWGSRTGFLVWSSSMYGAHDLVRWEWPSGRLTRLTKHPHIDRAPKISPDGRQLVFSRSRGAWALSRNRDEWDVWLLDLDTNEERLLVERGSEPSWAQDGQSVVFQRGGRIVVRLDLATGNETVLLSEREDWIWETPSLDPAGEHVAVTVRGRRHRTSLFSLSGGKETRMGRGYQLSYAPDGTWLVMVESLRSEPNHVVRVDRDGSNKQFLLRLDAPWTHMYFPRVSNDGDFLVFGASPDGGEYDRVRQEIFIWRIGDPPEDVARVSFHTGNDHGPDVWIHPGRY